MRHPNLSLNGFIAIDKVSRWNAIDNCFEIKTPHALSQLAGYAKYSLADHGIVLFRGQDKHYGQMRPSLFRNIQSASTAQSRMTTSMTYIKSIYKDNAFINNTPTAACEPLLQHYGLKTRWIDVVDNIWSALWFACHSAHTVGEHGMFVNYEYNTNKYSYIYMMQFGNIVRKTYQGIYKTDSNMYIADLRIAAPSMYLRPHSQHGLLSRRSDIKNDSMMDYSDCVVLVLKILTQDAINWLGQSTLVQDRFMFPSPKYDCGYKLLIEKKLAPPECMGRINYIGAQHTRELY